MVCVGIDVGLGSVHAVALDQALQVLAAAELGLSGIGPFCRQQRPDVVAVDAPQAWPPPGTRRLAEVELVRMGIRLFMTPSDPSMRARPFYAWMHTGMEVFRVLERIGYRPFGDRMCLPLSMEVLPHATTRILAGERPGNITKSRWRRMVLEREGVETDKLSNRHLVDACLAALTGIYAIAGRYRALGDQRTGLIVIPS